MSTACAVNCIMKNERQMQKFKMLNYWKRKTYSKVVDDLSEKKEGGGVGAQVSNVVFTIPKRLELTVPHPL